MKVEDTQIGGMTILGVADWYARGIAHGFLDARLDARAGEDVNGFFTAAFGRRFEIIRPKQTHSTTLVEAPFEEEQPEADAVVADFASPRLSSSALGVLSADCAPLLFVSRKSQRRAAVHCGWRGTVGGLLERTLEWYREQGEQPDEIEIAVGPAAGACCYEVGEEVLRELSPAERERCVSVRRRTSFLELTELLRHRAEQEGVPPANFAAASACTICDGRFFSYRRQREAAGRQLSFVGSGLRPTSVTE